MASPNVVSFSEKTFQQEVLGSGKPVLVDFWAEWCGPCKMIAPIIDELADEYQGKAVIGKVDVDSNQGLAVQYGITGIPTILFFKGGQVTEQVRGLKSKRDLKAILDRLVA